MTKPNFGGGELKDGGKVCAECFGKISDADPSVAWNSKKRTLNEMQEFLYPRSEIRNKIRDLNLPHQATFFALKEIDLLPEILAVGENPENLIQGYYNTGKGLLVSTTRRLIFIDKGLSYGLKVEDFPLDKISSIQHESGLLVAKVTIHTSGNMARIENVDIKAAAAFVNFVRDKISRPVKAQMIPPPLPLSRQLNVMEQLQKLGELKSSGILSDEEFATMKAKLIEQI